MNSTKDNRVELYRLMFAIIIMVFHAHNINNGQGHPIPLGHVFVEFFFFLTGYFTYNSVANRFDNDADIAEYALGYTFRKFRRFLPYTFMTAFLYVVVSFACDRHLLNVLLRDTVRDFSGLPFDLLYLQVTGICTNPNFNAWWYLSAILFCLPVAIMLFNKKIRSGGVFAYIVYFVPLLIYGAFSVNIGGLDWDREVLGILKSGMFRGFAGICVGCAIYDLKDRLVDIKFSSFQRMGLTIFEILAYLFSIFIAWKWSDVENSTFLIVLLLIVGLTITFSNKSYTTVLDRKIFSYAGMISMPLYICHYSIGRLIGRYYTNSNIGARYTLYFVCSFLFALCMILFHRLFVKGVRK